MIQIERMQVHYGSHLALNIEEPIQIEAGERVGIIGSNGAGKSTLVNALLQLIPYKGKVTSTFTRERMGVHMQQNEYADTMSCMSVLEAVTGASPKKDPRLQELIEFFDMAGSLKKKYKHLSGGQKQRFTLIMVLYQDADLVFFDEVTSGLDFESRQSLVRLLQKWYDQTQTTLCYISHYYEELENLVDKVLLLDHGEVVAYGTVHELFQKYCGHAIYTLKRTAENEAITKDLIQLDAPSHMIALRVDDPQSDLEIAKHLSSMNTTFKRSNIDIEIMSFNAKAQYNHKGAKA